MLIGKEWQIESDGLNVTLSRYHKESKEVSPKTGLPIPAHYTPEYYYSSLEAALKGLIRLEVKETELKDLQTVVNKINELEKYIHTALTRTYTG